MTKDRSKISEQGRERRFLLDELVKAWGTPASRAPQIVDEVMDAYGTEVVSVESSKRLLADLRRKAGVKP